MYGSPSTTVVLSSIFSFCIGSIDSVSAVHDTKVKLVAKIAINNNFFIIGVILDLCFCFFALGVKKPLNNQIIL